MHPPTRPASGSLGREESQEAAILSLARLRPLSRVNSLPVLRVPPTGRQAGIRKALNPPLPPAQTCTLLCPEPTSSLSAHIRLWPLPSLHVTQIKAKASQSVSVLAKLACRQPFGQITGSLLTGRAAGFTPSFSREMNRPRRSHRHREAGIITIAILWM